MEYNNSTILYLVFIVIIVIFLYFIIYTKTIENYYNWFGSSSKKKGSTKKPRKSWFSYGKKKSVSHSKQHKSWFGSGLYGAKHIGAKNLGLAKEKDKDVKFIETKGGKDCLPAEKKKSISRWTSCMVKESMFYVGKKTKKIKEKGMVAICKIIVGDALKGGSEGEKDVMEDVIKKAPGCKTTESCGRNTRVFAGLFVGGIHTAIKALSHVPAIKIVISIIKPLLKYTVGLPIIIMAMLYLTYAGQGAYIIECIFHNSPIGSAFKIVGGIWTAATKFSPSKFKDKTKLAFLSHVSSDKKLERELQKPQNLTLFEKFIKTIGKKFFLKNSNELKGIFLKNKKLADALNKVFPDVNIGAHTTLNTCLVDLKKIKYKQTDHNSELYAKYLELHHRDKQIEKFVVSSVNPYQEEMIEQENIVILKHRYKNLTKKQALEMLDVFKTIKFNDIDKKSFWNYYQNFELNVDNIYRSSLSQETIDKIDREIQENKNI